MPDILPTKKGKQTTNARKNGPMLPPKDKKKGPSKSKSTLSRMTSKVAARAAVPKEGS